ncbi:hypothetical protein HDZ31DRAFT_82757 [Schizophyllum fasciatum]
MNSPPEPASPLHSAPSSEDEIEEMEIITTSKTPQAAGPSQASSSKRRFAGGSAMRDAKSRRREDPARRGHHDGKEGKKDKEDMVDNDFLESLRKDVGDPFAVIASIKREAQ